MRLFLWGALAMGFSIGGLYFLRFWIESRDRFFLFFTLAFFALGAQWTGLAIVNPGLETTHLFFLVRLAAFVLIIVAVVDKNARTHS